jgi:hypothetical protein
MKRVAAGSAGCSMSRSNRSGSPLAQVHDDERILVMLAGAPDVGLRENLDHDRRVRTVVLIS